jgi:hypothetical protein
MSTSPSSADDRTPPQGQGVGLSVQQATRSTLESDLDGLIAAAEAGLATAPAERVAGYLGRILEDLPRYGLPTQAATAALGRAYQTLVGGNPSEAYAQLAEAARAFAPLAEHAPRALEPRLRRLAELLARPV